MSLRDIKRFSPDEIWHRGNQQRKVTIDNLTIRMVKSATLYSRREKSEMAHLQKVTANIFSLQRSDFLAKCIYLAASLSDGTLTILDRYLRNTPEATPVYRELIAKLGNGPGVAVSLGLEYLFVFGLHWIAPERIKPLIFLIPAYIHLMGGLAHLDLLTRVLPAGINSFVWGHVFYLNGLCQIFYYFSERLFR